MPTSQREAEKIIQLCGSFLTPVEMFELFTQLDEHVGQTTDNDSVRQSFAGMRQLAQRELDKCPWFHGWSSGLCKFLLFSLVLVHLCMVLVNIAAFFVAPFYAPWYLAAPACFSIIWVTCSPVMCTLTRWENNIRRRLALPMVKSFVGHYLLKPIYIGMRCVGL